jgi:uncharacterized low-complexity protein
MSNKIMKPLTLAVGAAIVGSLSLTSLAKADTQFVAKQLSQGYLLAGLAEGKCGEGKCGVAAADKNKDGKVSKEEFMAMKDHKADAFASMDTNKDGFLSDAEMTAGHKAKEGSCSGDKKAKEGSCSGDKKAKEGSCSGDKKAKEGSCSGDKKGKEGSCSGAL